MIFLSSGVKMGSKISKSRVRQSERNLGKASFHTARELIVPKLPLIHSPTSEPLSASTNVLNLALEIGDWSRLPETSSRRQSKLRAFFSLVKVGRPVAQNQSESAVLSEIKSRAPVVSRLVESDVPYTPSRVGSEELHTTNQTGPSALAEFEAPADFSEAGSGEHAASTRSGDSDAPSQVHSPLTSDLLIDQGSPHEYFKVLTELLHHVSKFPVPLQLLPLTEENEKMLQSSLRFLASLKHVEDKTSQTDSVFSGTQTENKCLPDGDIFCPNQTTDVSSSESLTNPEKSLTENGLALICEICYDEISMYNGDFDLSWDRHCQKPLHLLADGPTEKENPLVIPQKMGASQAEFAKTKTNTVHNGQRPNAGQQLSHGSEDRLSSSCPPQSVRSDQDYKSIRRAQLTFGSKGDGDGEFVEPWGVCFDRDGRLIVADSGNNRIQIFKADGTFLLKFGMKGTANGLFRTPTGVVSDRDGRIIVADSGNHRIQIFHQNGKFISAFGRSGSEQGCFRFPWDVDVNTAGEIVVSDSGNRRLQIFSPDGQFLFKWGTYKFSTSLRGVCFNSSDCMIATDSYKQNVTVIGVDNKCWDLGVKGTKGAKKAKKKGTDVPFQSPQGVAVGADGCIVVAVSRQIRIYRPNGIFICTIGWPTIEMHSPSGVCVTPDGKIIVADSGYNRVRIFQI